MEVGGTILVNLESSMKNSNYATVEFGKEIFHDVQIKKLFQLSYAFN